MEDQPVSISKEGGLFIIRSGFDAKLNAFFKSTPSSECVSRFINKTDSSGKPYKDWYRAVNTSYIVNVLYFLNINSIQFNISNVSKEEFDSINKAYAQKDAKINSILKQKNESIQFHDIDFSSVIIPPHDYQKAAVAFFNQTNGTAILGDNPGVGKSLPAMIYSCLNNYKTLIVSPASATLNWRNEILKFMGKKSFVFKYKPPKRSNVIVHTQEESQFHIISYNSLGSYIVPKVKHKCKNYMCKWGESNTTRKYKKCPRCNVPNNIKSSISGWGSVPDKDGAHINPKDYDMIILDEAHSIKNPLANRTKTIKGVFKKTPHKILLTGTAIKSRPMELYPLLNFLDSKTWNDKHEYGIKYCAGYNNGFGWNYNGASNLDVLFESISPHMLRRLKSDVLSELPPKTYTDLFIDMNATEAREYEKLENKFISELLEFDTKKLSADNFLEKIHTLEQFTGQVKLNRAKEILDSIIDAEDKIVVFSHYRDTVSKLKEMYGDRAVCHHGGLPIHKKQEAVDRFQSDPSINIFIGTILASGQAITLTAANKVLILYLPWTPGDLEQAEDRCHRANVKNNVQIIKMIVQGTIDEYKKELLEGKSVVTSKVLDGREIIKTFEAKRYGVLKDLMNIYMNMSKKHAA